MKKMDTNYLVGVVRQKSQGCGNAALGCQQAGILTHLLSQKSPDSIGVQGLGELYSFAEDDNFLNQILNERKAKEEETVRRNRVGKLPRVPRRTAPALPLFEERQPARRRRRKPAS
jgi:hypothetical protein